MNIHDIKRESQKRVLIAAHRGVAAGNIPCNTLPAFNRAITDGADIIELDVAISKDNQLFVFHPGMENAHLNTNRLLKNMSADEIRKLRYVNSDNTQTQFGISTFDEALEFLKGKCLINVDKFWTNPKKISDTIRNHNMTDDVLIKTPIDDEFISAVETYGYDFPYITIGYKDYEMHKKIKEMRINYVGIEVLFENEKQECARPEFISKMRDEEMLLWVNSIVYDYKTILAAGHNDDVSIMGEPQNGWGWLERRGYNIIQTDWVKYVKEYFDARG